MSVDYDARFDKYAIKVAIECPPYGHMAARHHDHWKAKRVAARILLSWATMYWPKIHAACLDLKQTYGHANLFGKYPFEIHFNKSGGWISDDVMFELLFVSGNDRDDTGPFWVIAFSGTKIVHKQASF